MPERLLPTRTLSIRGIPDTVLGRLRERASANRRSLNGELLAILERAAAEAQPEVQHPTQTRATHGLPASSITVREPAAAYADASPANTLADIDRDALAGVCRRHHIVWLAVFGSRARGDARPDSDADVVVDFAEGMTPGFGIVRVADALRPVFGGLRVDIVTRRGLSPRLREAILSSAVELYAAE